MTEEEDVEDGATQTGTNLHIKFTIIPKQIKIS